MSEAIPSLLFSGALIWLLLATFWRLLSWALTPSPLPIPLTPAPRSRWAVLGRLLLELFAFRSLARANVSTWAASIAFHYGLLLVLIMHLRFVLVPLPLWLVPFIRFSGFACLALVLGLGVLLLRRVIVDRVRYISSPSDYLNLMLLLAIAFTGLALKRVWPTDLAVVTAFVRGLFIFDWQPLWGHAGLWLHMILALLLVVIFPISKLVHGVGVLFSPTFNQRDNNS